MQNVNECSFSSTNRCDGVYDVPVLEHIMRWKDEVLLQWIDLLLNDVPQNSTASSNARDVDPATKEASPSAVYGAGKRRGGPGGTRDDDIASYGWEQRLGLAVHQAFCSARIAELFDIIADYPDSAMAIGELKVGVDILSRVRDISYQPRVGSRGVGCAWR